jgi:aminomuconate-semialdehyde/2-hydroxymuconate-6-semialdehyde dehydrogenase
MSTLWRPELRGGDPAGPPGLLRNYVGGAFVSSDRTFAKVSPVTGETVFEVARPTPPRSTPRSPPPGRAARAWGRMGEQQRARVLRRVPDELERRFEDLVTAEVADTGKPISQAAP